MPAVSQLARQGKKSKTYKSDLPALSRSFNSIRKSYTKTNSSQKGGICTSVRTMAPKKPNSASHKVARVRLTSGMEALSYTPDIGHNLQEHSTALIRGGRVKDLLGVRYHIIRGTLDTAAAQNRMQGRPKYDARKPKR